MTTLTQAKQEKLDVFKKLLDDMDSAVEQDPHGDVTSIINGVLAGVNLSVIG